MAGMVLEGWSGGGGGCWTPSLGGVFWSLAGKPLLCWDEPLLPAGRLWLPGCGKGGIGPSSGPDRAWHPGVRDKADEKPGETERNVPLASGPRALCYLPRWDRARFVRPASNFSPPWPGLVSSTPVGGLNCRACPAPHFCRPVDSAQGRPENFQVLESLLKGGGDSKSIPQNDLAAVLFCFLFL